MAHENHARLLELAESIGDRSAVDWPAESFKHPELNEIISRLQKVECVATAFRNLQNFDEGSLSNQPALFTWGHLQVLEKLGEGSFGEVFRAFDPLLQRDVALKLRRLGPSHQQGSGHRFVEEARRLARIRHHNVVAVFGTDLHQDRVGIWTELIAGSSLAERLASDGTLGPHEVVSVGVEVCRALAAVHSVGLVHGDVKAANVMRESGGRIVLTDFGSGSEAGASTAPGGSPASIAPEVLSGEPLRPASDLYSLGVLLFHLLTGTFPIIADNPFELMEAHRKGSRRYLRDLRPELPAEIIFVVEKALAVTPAERFASAGDMERALTRSSHQSPTTTVDTPVQPQEPTVKRRRLTPRTFLVAASVIVSVATLAFFFFPRAAAQRPKHPTTSVAAQHGPVPQQKLALVEPEAPAHGQLPAAEISEAFVVNAPSTLNLEATLFHGSGESEIALVFGASISPGDLLHLELNTPDEVYLYVLNEDRYGDVFVLFPIAGLDLENPLREGQYRLPGRLDGVPQEWRVTSTGGTETFLLVASRSRELDLEQQIAGIRAAAANPHTQVNDTLRGVGGLSRAPRMAHEGSILAPIHDTMRRRQEQHGSVWVRRFELVNPT